MPYVTAFDFLMRFADGYLLPGALWFVMFTIGLGLRPSDFRTIFSGRRAYFLGLVSELLLVPACGIALALSFGPTPALTVGLILLATTPGGILSNMITFLAKGDVTISVSLTLSLSLIYIVTLPFIAHFALLIAFGEAQNVDIPLESSVGHILFVTVLPICTGMVLGKVAPKLSKILEPKVRFMATTILVVVFGMICIQQFPVLRESFGSLLAIVAAMNMAAIILALAVCRLGKLNRAETIAVAVEHMIRQEGTAIFVAVTLLHRHDMSIPMIINTFIGMALCLSFFAIMKRLRPTGPAPIAQG